MLQALLLVDGQILLLMARSYCFSRQKPHILLLFPPKHLISSGCGDGIKVMLYFPIQSPHFLVEFGMAVCIILHLLKPVQPFVLYSNAYVFSDYETILDVG